MVEKNVSLVWRKRCGTNACVEVATIDGRVMMRDSEDPEGPWLEFGGTDWNEFVGGLRAGRLRPFQQ